MHEHEHGTSVTALHDVTVAGDLVALFNGINPDVAWVIQPPREAGPGEIYAFRHGVTTTVITKRPGDDPEHDGPNAVQRQDTHTHATVEGAQTCIERNVIKFCQMGALVVSGPYVYVPPVPPVHPLLAMLAQAMGVPLPESMSSPESGAGDQDPAFSDLADQLRAMGLDLDDES